jgi:hypothetical protein
VLIKHHVKQTQRAEKSLFYVFLTSKLEGTWTALSPGYFATGERATGLH